MQACDGQKHARRFRMGALALSVAVSALLAGCVGGNREDESIAALDTGNGQPGVVLGESRSGAFLAGRFALNQHQPGIASGYLLHALAGDPENVDLLQRTYLALAADGRLADAAVVARQLLRFDGEAIFAAMLVAEQDAKAGKWADAEAQVAKLPRRGFSTFLTPLMMAWSRVGQGKTDAALDAIRPLAQNSAYATMYDFQSALINDLADRRKPAEQNYRAVMSGEGNLALRAVQAASDFYRRTGQPDKAAEAVSRYRNQHGDQTSIELTNDLSRPVNNAQEGLAETLFGAASSLRQGNSPELALIFGRMALDLRPDFPLCQILVADLMQSMGQLADADAIYAAIPAGSPVRWSAQLRLAANLDDMGEVDQAVQILQALSDAHPERIEGLIVLGDVLRNHQRWAEAVPVYDRAITLAGPPSKDQWSLYYFRGMALERSKQWPRAEKDFLHALELFPDEPRVLNYLGYSWVDLGMNLEQARKMIEKAVSLRPTDGEIVDSLGWAHYRLGNFPKAVEALERAVELHPEDPTINEHLGDAFWQAGRETEARFQWKRALSFKPDPDQKQSLEKKLAEGLKKLPSGKPAPVSAQ